MIFVLIREALRDGYTIDGSFRDAERRLWKLRLIPSRIRRRKRRGKERRKKHD
jgi:hypothetical protein